MLELGRARITATDIIAFPKGTIVNIGELEDGDETARSMCLLFNGREFGLVANIFTDPNHPNVLFVHIGKGLESKNVERFFENFFDIFGENVHITEYGCYIDHCHAGKVAVGREYSHLDWEILTEESNLSLYAETRFCYQIL